MRDKRGYETTYLMHWFRDGAFELSLVFRLKQANHPIVLELLADGPHEDWAQDHLRREYMTKQATSLS